MMNCAINKIIFTILLLASPTFLYASIDEGKAKKITEEFINKSLPEYIQVSYTESNATDEESWAIKYDYDSSRKWDVNPTVKDDVMSFGASGSSMFVKGAYNFSDEDAPENYSQVGGEYKRRWLNVYISSKILTEEENKLIDECLLKSSDFRKSVDDCREENGFGRTELSLLYFDLDVHLKIEGNRDFKERNYVYGLGLKFSAIPGKDSWVHKINFLEYPGRLLRGSTDSYRTLPILSFGVEQVDPKQDSRRAALVADNTDIYDRAYFEIRHTSPLGAIKGNPLKLSFSWKYFKEINAPSEIRTANLDVNRYYTIALQVPSAVLPHIATKDSGFIISYSEGTLPFGRVNEKVFELGWQTNVDFGKMFVP